MADPLRVALIGATGAVGSAFLEILAERRFPIASLDLYASARSAGKRLSFAGEVLEVKPLANDQAIDADVVFASAGGNLSKAQAWRWAEKGAVVIDNSSAWRMDERVPLVIPEINGDDALQHPGVIANPNCSTIIALMALAPLHRAFTLQRATVATYQAVSGAGAAGIGELREQSTKALAGESLQGEVFQHPIAFNLFSHDSAIGEDGYNVEERKLLLETRKILHQDNLRISATCVRVPVFRAHSEAIHAEFSQPVSPEQAREVLCQAAGLRIVDDRANNHFPMPLEASDRDEVLVGRLREDSSYPGGLAFFVAGDQIRKGAALNAVQIAEYMLEHGALSRAS